MREAVIRRGLAAGFHPSFAIQRRGVPGTLSGATVIEKGDFLWCDFGHIGMGLWTDTQHMGYVLADGEEGVPAGFLAGLAKSNRAQDAVLANLEPGRSGNEVLAAVVADLNSQGIDSLIYCHPIGTGCCHACWRATVCRCALACMRAAGTARRLYPSCRAICVLIWQPRPCRRRRPQGITCTARVRPSAWRIGTTSPLVPKARSRFGPIRGIRWNSRPTTTSRSGAINVRWVDAVGSGRRDPPHLSSPALALPLVLVRGRGVRPRRATCLLLLLRLSPLSPPPTVLRAWCSATCVECKAKVTALCWCLILCGGLGVGTPYLVAVQAFRSAKRRTPASPLMAPRPGSSSGSQNSTSSGHHRKGKGKGLARWHNHNTLVKFEYTMDRNQRASNSFATLSGWVFWPWLQAHLALLSVQTQVQPPIRAGRLFFSGPDQQAGLEV